MPLELHATATSSPTSTPRTSGKHKERSDSQPSTAGDGGCTSRGDRLASPRTSFGGMQTPISEDKDNNIDNSSNISDTPDKDAAQELRAELSAYYGMSLSNLFGSLTGRNSPSPSNSAPGSAVHTPSNSRPGSMKHSSTADKATSNVEGDAAGDSGKSAKVKVEESEVLEDETETRESTDTCMGADLYSDVMGFDILDTKHLAARRASLLSYDQMRMQQLVAVEKSKSFSQQPQEGDGGEDDAG